MEVFLLAAGLGTRLRPLTNTRPKALVEIGEHPLLEINIKNLIAQGASRIIINIHHFGNQIIDYIQAHQWNTEIIISDERNQLLDTGGGLKYASSLFTKKEPILIHNVDILSKIPLQELIHHHNESKNIATLAVSKRITSRYLLYNHKEQLIGWHNTKSNEFIWNDTPHQNYTSYAFSGIAVINPNLLDLLPPPHPYPIIPEYLKISKYYHIGNYKHNANEWLDVGKPETLHQAQLWYNHSI